MLHHPTDGLESMAKTNFSHVRILMVWRKWLLMTMIAVTCGCARVDVSSPSRADPSEHVSSGVFTTAHPTAALAVKDFWTSIRSIQQSAHRLQSCSSSRIRDCNVMVLIRRRGSRTRCAHSGGGILHDLPPGDSHRPPRNQENCRLQGAGRRDSMGAGLQLQRIGPREVQPCTAYPGTGGKCATCHDDMTKQTTAERKVNLNMGFCINCHVKKQVSIDCVTCH